MNEIKDSRVQGRAAEAIFVSLLQSKYGVHAVQMDTIGFDVVAWDNNKICFPSGHPAYIQIKLRMSTNAEFTAQGHNPAVFDKVKKFANKLGIEENNCYFCAAFSKNNDVRDTVFFLIPFNKLDCFKNRGVQYRFSVKSCKQVMQNEKGILKL